MGAIDRHAAGIPLDSGRPGCRNARVRGPGAPLVCALLLVAGAASSACRPGEPLQVESLQLGRTLNSDNTVNAHTTRFKPDDTVFVSLLSVQPGSGTVTVRWMLNGQTVSEATRDVSYTREAATEFHLQNSGGFPPGGYRVDVLVNGQPAGSRQFTVER